MKKILVAEDEEHIAKLVAFKLSRDGYQVVIAENGQEALSQLQAAGPGGWDLLILDVMMPIKDGWEVLKEVRAPGSAFLSLPVLMMTAKGSSKDVTEAADLGATQYLKKPFDPQELSAVVKEIFHL